MATAPLHVLVERRLIAAHAPDVAPVAVTHAVPVAVPSAAALPSSGEQDVVPPADAVPAPARRPSVLVQGGVKSGAPAKDP